MTNPMDRMLERAMDRSGSDTSSDSTVIRRPGRYETAYNDDLNLRERGDTEDLISAIRDTHVDSLTPEQRDQLLKEMLKRSGQQVDRKRDIQMQGDELDLDNKRKFSSLALTMAKWTFGFIGFCVLFLLGLLCYGIVFDKSLIDSTLVNGFLSTFGEVFKALFSVF